MEILSPEKEFELPFKKNVFGEYVILPKHIGGKNCLRKLAASKVSEAYVYLIKIEGHDKYKIGVSSNPKKRLSNISSYLPFGIHILSINFIKNAYDFEQSLLDKYSNKLIKNEWFNLAIEEAKEIMILLHNTEVNERG